MSFSSDIGKFIAKANRNVDSVVRKIVVDLGTSLVMKTPVGNPTLWKNPDGAPAGYVGGAARANWQYGNGTNPEGFLDAIDKGGNATINKIIGGVKSSPTASIHWIANNLPYIERLETGWSKQAPQGMLRLTVTEFEQTVRDAVKNVN